MFIQFSLCLGTGVCSGLGSAGGTLGLHGLEGLFQPKQFHGSEKGLTRLLVLMLVKNTERCITSCALWKYPEVDPFPPPWNMDTDGKCDWSWLLPWKTSVPVLGLGVQLS